jgi:hypothetical protein
MTSDEKALIAVLVAAFLLSKADIKDMAVAILAGRIASMKASYQQASDTVGADTDWEPSDDLQSEIKDISEQDAEGIAATYKDDLESVASAFIVSWMSTHDTLDGCEEAARQSLSTWATQRSSWKSEQIADYTCSNGASLGIDQWASDLIDEEIDLPEGLSADDVEVMVLPEEATCAQCKAVAGQSFSVDEIDTIEEFPIHSGCDHRKTIQMK